jgi:hypothetical protein
VVIIESFSQYATSVKSKYPIGLFSSSYWAKKFFETLSREKLKLEFEVCAFSSVFYVLAHASELSL